MESLVSGRGWGERVIFFLKFFSRVKASHEKVESTGTEPVSPEASFPLLDRATSPWAGGGGSAHRPGGPFSEEHKGIASHLQFLGAGKMVGNATFVSPVGLK